MKYIGSKCLVDKFSVNEHFTDSIQYKHFLIMWKNNVIHMATRFLQIVFSTGN